jgi:3-oxoacyl-[acyl-carrier protein] reductase
MTATRTTRRHHNQPKIAVVTGIPLDIAASALRLSREGYVVVTNCPEGGDEGQSQAIVDGVNQDGGRALLVTGDLGTLKGIELFFDELDAVLVSECGSNQFDALVVSAVTISAATIESTTEAMFDRTFDANVKGTFFTIQYALPRLRSGGSIVAIGVGLSPELGPEYVAYTASRGALTAMTQVLADDLRQADITVNAIASSLSTSEDGFGRSTSFAKRLFSPQSLGLPNIVTEVASAISYLCGPHSRWLTGQRIDMPVLNPVPLDRVAHA